MDSKIQVSEFWSAISCVEAQDMSLTIFVSEASIPPGFVSVKITPQIIVPLSLQQQTATTGKSAVGTIVCYYLTISHEIG